MQEQYPTVPPVRLHGLELEADTAFRLNTMALCLLGDALNEATTFAAYEIAAGFLRSTMLDAISTMGATVADLVRFTSLGPDVVLDLLDALEPFSASPGAE